MDIGHTVLILLLVYVSWFSFSQARMIRDNAVDRARSDRVAESQTSLVELLERKIERYRRKEAGEMTGLNQPALPRVVSNSSSRADFELKTEPNCFPPATFDGEKAIALVESFTKGNKP